MSEKLFTVPEVMEKLGLKSRMSLQLREEKARIKVKKGTRGKTKVQINLYTKKDIEAMLELADPRRHPRKGE